MKKLTKWFFTSILALGLLSACGSDETDGSSTTDGDQGGSGSSDEVVTLNMFQFKVEIADQLLEMLQEFHEEHPNIRVQLETVGGGADYSAALKAKFASGEQPDIFNNGGFTELGLWKEHLADLSDEPWVEHLLPIGAVPMTDTDGKLYGMPVNLEGYGFIYNKDLFAEAGITEEPTTYSELLAAVQKLEENDITAFSAGYAEWWVIGQHLLNIPFAEQDDPAAFIDALSEGTETMANNQKFIDFQRLVDLEIEYGNSNPLTTDYNSQVTYFATGETAIIQQGNWIENMIYELNPEMNMGILPISLDDNGDARLPIGVPNNWAVNKNSPHIEEAKLLLDWMVSSETGQRYMTEEFAFIPAFDHIEPTGLGALGEVILEYSSDDQTLPWNWFRWPDGANQDFAAIIQEYVAGQIDYDTVLERMDSTWQNLK
ncbi:ABC transporter substrate-binding protein [Alkalihalobacillus alcalophilus ATCC 27647 = CGMCC 1.3604]|uniref:ABC transporter substrate-binding protein n=1 Tax=Alkalihalobacillus alcalophilus ATCC 27647 = CGMCC 1.3604 TaxID=1218173 RepID=A0A094WL27_ALKAL|nr:ABC transporter substrate-binding protein [Alkalihalobacillus alcalophilus]KGA97566.1 ABC transporter substrate-binding protein [Alkalihalobacillus alcalophilus ATCC 27647 = CGMCC 1.3604]MED1562970.1 ABC transporter substrate-binding protein [Alkalihalobacillus alcalophilus]THG91134.1 ABC transporter substrate-binding protein [Alkalihalobacillus alcalophilus ATCC 27647 = CGMCC 1.3604]